MLVYVQTHLISIIMIFTYILYTCEILLISHNIL
nr:MAG TPA: hypothetical protein [Caudoviricetes sp.]